jgi:hypothetical protein
MTSTLLKLLGAVTGLAAVITFAGGAVLWVRFDAIGLPADQVITLLPKELLLTIGARELLLPVALGGALGALLVGLAPLRGDRYALLFWLVLGIVLFVTVVALVVLASGLDWLAIFGMLAATVLALGGVLAVALVVPNGEAFAWTVAAAILLIAVPLTIAREAQSPRVEPVAMLLDGRPDSVAGFYIGQTKDRVYIAPLPGSGASDDPFADQPLDRVLELHRDNIRQLVLHAPVDTTGDGPGRDEARTLLADLHLAGATVPVVPVTTADPVATFAPLVNLHVHETSWPMTTAFFLRHAWLTWSAPDCPLWIQGAKQGEGAHGAVEDHRALMGVDAAKLAGPDAYARAPVDAGCDEGSGAKVPADAHTRPWDSGNGRPRGLPLREGWALDLGDDARTPAPRLDRDEAQQVLQDVPVYFERHQEGIGERITYWFFYGLSRPPGEPSLTDAVSHEGDWERISVLVEHQPGSATYLPLSVRFHTHDGHRDIAWRAVTRISAAGSPGATHPVAYSARGSHATYWRTGDYAIVVKALGKPAFSVEDHAMACSGCPEWRTWERLVDATTQPWYGFGGAWGRAGSLSGGGTTGPLGPSSYKAAGANPSPTRTLSRATTPTVPAQAATPAAPPAAG